MVFVRCCVYKTQYTRFFQMDELGKTEEVFVISVVSCPRKSHQFSSLSGFWLSQRNVHTHTQWLDYRKTITALPLEEMMRFSLREQNFNFRYWNPITWRKTDNTEGNIKKGKSICLITIQTKDLHRDKDPYGFITFFFFFSFSLCTRS